MTSRDFKEKLTPPPSPRRHISSQFSGPPFKYDVTNFHPPAAYSVAYRYESQAQREFFMFGQMCNTKRNNIKIMI